jgi:putative flippase GtrA
MAEPEKPTPQGLMRLLQHPLVRYVIVGGCSAALEISLLIGAVEYLHIQYLIANIFAFTITNVLNYTASRLWVFEKTGARKRVELPIFALFLGIGLAINQAALWFLVQKLMLDYRIAKVLSIGFVVVWNFFTRKHFVFKKIFGT